MKDLDRTFPSRRLLALALALALVSPFALSAENSFKGCEEHVRFGAPQYTKPLHEAVPLCRLGYALSHNSARKLPDWVAWHLTAKKATGCLPRKDSFKADPDLPKGKRAETSDYRKSGYDKGHMAPNADFLWSAEAQRESFLLSNMAPQLHVFNAGIWERLEEFTRVWATDRGEVYIVAGPMFSEDSRRTIGGNKVGVPDQFFKIVFDPQAREALAFVFPHGQIKPDAVAHFQVTVREIEQRTGLNFLSRLADNEENKVETAKPALWPADVNSWKASKKRRCAAN